MADLLMTYKTAFTCIHTFWAGPCLIPVTQSPSFWFGFIGQDKPWSPQKLHRTEVAQRQSDRVTPRKQNWQLFGSAQLLAPKPLGSLTQLWPRFGASGSQLDMLLWCSTGHQQEGSGLQKITDFAQNRTNLKTGPKSQWTKLANQLRETTCRLKHLLPCGFSLPCFGSARMGN